MWKKLRRFAHSPLVNVTVGVLMIATAAIELADDAFSTIGAGHGLLLAGVLQAMKTVPELFEGIEKVGDRSTEGEQTPRS